MEVRREVSINEDGHQVTTFIIGTQQREILFTTISNGDELIFMDTTPALKQQVQETVS